MKVTEIMSGATKGLLVVSDAIKYLYYIGDMLFNIASIRYSLEKNPPTLLVNQKRRELRTKLNGRGFVRARGTGVQDYLGRDVVSVFGCNLPFSVLGRNEHLFGVEVTNSSETGGIIGFFIHC